MSNDRMALARLLMDSLYTGDLNNGPSYPYRGLLASPATPSEIEKMLRAEQERRLPELLTHFGIDPASADCWRELALALAARHVPGFQWDYAPALGFGSLGGLGIGASFPMPAPDSGKRKRGRPPKPKFYGGLLNMKLPSRRGRPALRTVEEKRQDVEAWDEAKARHQIKTDRALAEAVARHQLPGARTGRVIERARKIASDISTWRRELKRLKNRPENAE